MEAASSKDELFLKNIRGIVTDNLADEQFGAEELVRLSGMTRYKLGKKLQEVTGKNPNQYIREIRLQKAFELIRDGSLTMSEIAFKTGFSSPAYFSKCFHDQYGYSPGQTRNMTGETQRKDAGKQFHISKALYFSMVFGVLIAAGLFLYPWMLKSVKVTASRQGIVVMPFENLTGNPEWDYWGRAIQRDLMSALVQTGEFSVRNESSINTLLERVGAIGTSVPPSTALMVSKKLNADIYINGSLKKFEQQIRLDAHLIEAPYKIVRKSFEESGIYINERTVLYLIDSLRRKLTRHLQISNIIRNNRYYQHLFTAPNSVEAMRYYDNAFKSDDPAEDIHWLRKALKADSSFHRAALALEYAYGANLQTDSSRIWLIKNFNNRYMMQEHDMLNAGWAYSFTFDSPEEQIKYLSGLLKLDDQDPVIHYLLGLTYCLNREFERAIPNLERSLRIFKQWGHEFLSDPRNSRNFKWLGIAYHNSGQYEKEKKLYRKAGKYIKNDPAYQLMNAVVAMNEKDTAKAGFLIKQAGIQFRKLNPSENEMMIWIARYFKFAGFYDLAGECFRASLELEPENINNIILFADFCQVSGRYNYPEIMERGMMLAPDKQTYCEFLAMKGMCLFNDSNESEGRQLIRQAWNEAPFKTYILSEFLRKTKSKG